MADYRSSLYSHYASIFQNSGIEFDAIAAERLGPAYEYYFRGWMPENKNGAILDLACGDGKVLYFFRKWGFTNLSGVDISLEQVMLSRQVMPEVKQCNAIDFLEEHPDSFDLITGLNIIEHLTKDEVCLFMERCFAALKPGGRLVLLTPNADSPFSCSVRYADFTHEVCFNPRSLDSTLKVFGFKRIEMREAGPPPRGYSALSSLRWLIWRLLCVGIGFWNLVETGSSGSGIFTRVFLIKAEKAPRERPTRLTSA